jgi:hypothetical protein
VTCGVLQVKIFKLRQAAQPWMHPSCPLTSLTPAGHGLLMATFSDSSIRLVRGWQAACLAAGAAQISRKRVVSGLGAMMRGERLCT